MLPSTPPPPAPGRPSPTAPRGRLRGPLGHQPVPGPTAKRTESEKVPERLVTTCPPGAQDDNADAGDGDGCPGHVGATGPFAEQRPGDQQHQGRLQGTDHRRIGNAGELHRTEEQGDVATKQDAAGDGAPKDGPVEPASADDQQGAHKGDAEPKPLEGDDQAGLFDQDHQYSREPPHDHGERRRTDARGRSSRGSGGMRADVQTITVPHGAAS